MAKEATLQVRMDADLKEDVEQLYKKLGTSFAEAVRIFAKQSLTNQGLPFIITVEKQSACGMLNKYANPELQENEKYGFEKAAIDKHVNEID